MTSEKHTTGGSRKEAALAFLKLAAAGKAREAFDRYVGANFCHHNPYFRGDRESLLSAMEENAAKNTHKTFDVKRALEDADLVAVHSHVRPNADVPGAAVVHIFRFEGDRIVELWDVGQPVAQDTPNENGMF